MLPATRKYATRETVAPQHTALDQKTLLLKNCGTLTKQ